MMPAASVSGLYFSHPQAKYFNVGRIGRDQAQSYAKRKGMPLEEVERWLAPNLAYEAAAVADGGGVRVGRPGVAPVGCFGRRRCPIRSVIEIECG